MFWQRCWSYEPFGILPCVVGPGWLSRYSDSLRAGYSEDRITVGWVFPHLSRPDLGPIEAPAQWILGFFPRGTAARTWRSPTPLPPPVAPRLKNEKPYTSTPSLGLHGLFYGELYLTFDWLWAGRSGDRIPLEARFSAPVQTSPGAHTASSTMGTASFPGVKSGRGVTLTLHSLLVPWSRKGRAIPLLPLWAVRPVQSLSACTRVHFIFIYLTLPHLTLCCWL